MLKVFKSKTDDATSNTPTRVLAASAGQADLAAIRTETFGGKEYTVVPVVAIVEGVLHGANAATPEFAPAAAFGQFPMGWNGRPVVMNHPTISGVFVSAGLPNVMEDFAMGYMFATHLDGDKLKTEAWIDNAKVQEAGGEMQSTLDRILKGEMVEVSVGAWIEVTPTVGTFKGKKYNGEWSVVVPDHLAFLSEGVPGACSNKDGCGVPRLNQAHEADAPADVNTSFVVYSAATTSTEVPEAGDAGETPCCDACANGNGEPCAAKAKNLSAEQEAVLRAERHSQIFEHLSVNAIDPSIVVSDATKLVRQALVEYLNVPSYDMDIMAMTTEVVVYYVWGSNWKFQQINYSVASDGSVTLTGDPVPVDLLTRIQPRQTSTTGLNMNERNTNMPGENGQNQGTGSTAAGGNAAPETPVVVNANTAELPSPAKVATFSELLEAASPQDQAAWKYGMKAYQARHAELVKGVSALKSNPYSDEELKAFTVEQLEKIAQLANVQTFNGVAIPGGEEVQVNAAPKQKFAPVSNFLGAKE